MWRTGGLLGTGEGERCSAGEQSGGAVPQEKTGGGGGGACEAAACRPPLPPPTGSVTGRAVPPPFLLPEGRRRPWRRRGEPSGAPPLPAAPWPPGGRRGEAAPSRWYVSGGRAGWGGAPGRAAAASGEEASPEGLRRSRRVPAGLPWRSRRCGAEESSGVFQEGLLALVLCWLALPNGRPGVSGTRSVKRRVFNFLTVLHSSVTPCNNVCVVFFFLNQFFLLQIYTTNVVWRQFSQASI